MQSWCNGDVMQGKATFRNEMQHFAGKINTVQGSGNAVTIESLSMVRAAAAFIVRGLLLYRRGSLFDRKRRVALKLTVGVRQVGMSA